MFKRIVLTSAFSVISFLTVFAQTGHTDKGRISIGTSSGFSFASINVDGLDDNLKIINFSVAPSYFVMDNLSVGAVFSYQYTDIVIQTDKSTSFGVQARYYYNDFFLGTGYLLSKSDGADAVGTIPVELGYSYFLNDYVAIEPEIGYLFGANNNDTGTMLFGAGFSIFLK